MSSGPVSLTMALDPAIPEFTEDLLLTIEVGHPAEVTVTLPPLDDRLSGFRIGGSYDEPARGGDGRVSLRRRIRLTPVVAEEHRIAPFAVRWEDHGVSPPRAGWFPTRAVEVEIAAPPAGGKPDLRLKPRWIAPSPWSVLRAAAVVALAAALVLFAWRLLRRLRREAALRRMSPRERALSELLALLARDLIAKNQPKEFYLELTMIVRRYIERQHGVRAPEQTTPEFLGAVRDDPRFPPHVVRKLRDFLEAADLVKFAARRPQAGAGELAAQTARDYIQTDSAAAPADATAPVSRGEGA
jgi:hypothetical protein